MRPRLTAILVIVVSLITGGVHAAWGQNLVEARGERSYQRSQAGGMSLDEAVRMVESRYRARAVRAETINNGGRRVHEIRLLSPDGKVWKVRVDADTGRSY